MCPASEVSYLVAQMGSGFKSEFHTLASALPTEQTDQPQESLQSLCFELTDSDNRMILIMLQSNLHNNLIVKVNLQKPGQIFSLS